MLEVQRVRDHLHPTERTAVPAPPALRGGREGMRLLGVLGRGIDLHPPTDYSGPHGWEPDVTEPQLAMDRRARRAADGPRQAVGARRRLCRRGRALQRTRQDAGGDDPDARRPLVESRSRGEHRTERMGVLMFNGVISDLNYQLGILQVLPKSRELALAITRLEECIMWLNSAYHTPAEGFVPRIITDKIDGHENDQPPAV